MGGRWPYSWRLVGCCLQDLFNILVGCCRQDLFNQVTYKNIKSDKKKIVNQGVTLTIFWRMMMLTKQPKIYINFHLFSFSNKRILIWKHETIKNEKKEYDGTKKEKEGKWMEKNEERKDKKV